MRTPRRSFAAPFVVTMVGAAGSAGFTSCNPPPQQRGGPDPVIATNPRPDPVTEPAAGERRWTVYKQGEDCFAGMKIECPKADSPGAPVPTCNPPPPVKYSCPENIAMDRPIEIAQWAGQSDCQVVHEPMPCPAGAACNPPPPQIVACPSR